MSKVSLEGPITYIKRGQGLGYLGGLGQLNFRKLNSLALSGANLGLDGEILCLQRF